MDAAGAHAEHRSVLRFPSPPSQRGEEDWSRGQGVTPMPKGV
jgi:hypothetical protein